jgi:hypothetical protein
MNKLLLRIAFAAVLIFSTQAIFAQGTTTSGMNGRVVGTNSETLPGATVVAVDVPSGSQYGTVTDLDGFYRLPNMNVGGPYKITITFVGYEPFVKEGIFLTLGQTLKLDVNLSEQAQALEGVEIVAQQNDIFDGNRTGAETYVSNAEIQKMPTINRSISDFARVTPQADVDDNGAISIAGMNNRYNAISIDGAVNNDVFGLSASGTNGGQTGGTAISLDAIDQFQVALAPYDVRQGGFVGASINAVTRRGTNEFEGSAYWLYRNQGMAGETPGALQEEGEDAEKLADFTATTYGFRLGGPIIKNKLFFFVNAEFQRDETPKPYSLSEYTGDSDAAALNAFSQKLVDYGYDPGGYLDKLNKLESDKIIARIDWNISEHHKLTLRNSYVNNTSTTEPSSSKTSISFANNGIYFPSKTNSFAAELKSNWNDKNNNLIVGYTTVRDNRDPIGGKFPALTIYDGAGTIYAGSEAYSTGNQLDQDILTVTDNFTIYKGRNAITFGVNFELNKSYNMFMRKAFGEYRYLTLEDFMNNATIPAYQYERGYSLVDDVVGDGSAAAADFRTAQFGFYIQDEFQVSDNFKLTAGLRFDIPWYMDQPNPGPYGDEVWQSFNDSTLALCRDYGYDTEGAEAGQMPKAQLMFNPRVGFNWDVKGDQKTQLRGGLGLFTSRLPLVWPGGSYTNNGVTIGGVYHRSSWGTPIWFKPGWDDQYTATDFGASDPIPSGQMDLFAEDFKNPQMFRTSLAVDQKLPWGMIGTLEGIYTKTINNVLYLNLNEVPAEGNHITAGEDQRPLYPGEMIDSRYTRIMLGTNTKEGYSYNFTAQLTKQFDQGFNGTVAYTFGRSMAMNDGTSSQNSSQWRYMENVNGLNHLDLSYSDFDMGSRLMIFLSYRAEYAKRFATTVGLYYNGQSGSRYSYVYNDYGDLNGEGENAGNLIWVPENESQINLVPIGGEGEEGYISVADQWASLNSFISSDKRLDDARGSYAERNGSRLPFESFIDLKLAQDIVLNVSGKHHTIQVTFDIFNFTNLLNKDWGTRRYITNDAFQLVNFEGFDEDGTTPRFTYQGTGNVEDIYNIDDSGVQSSRWQGQLGIRYIFN